MNTIELADGRRLAYEVAGDEDAAPVIFHHGTGDSRLARHPDERLLAEAGVRLVTVDRPGYGGSTPRPGRTLLDWPADAAQLADHLGWARFSVIGWSGGGPHALAVAHTLGDRISRVTLASPLGPLSAPGALDTVHKDFRLLWRLRRPSGSRLSGLWGAESTGLQILRPLRHLSRRDRGARGPPPRRLTGTGGG